MSENRPARLGEPVRPSSQLTGGVGFPKLVLRGDYFCPRGDRVPNSAEPMGTTPRKTRRRMSSARPPMTYTLVVSSNRFYCLRIFRQVFIIVYGVKLSTDA